MLPLWKSHIIKQNTGPEDPEFQQALQDALSQVSPADVISIADELAERRNSLFLGLESTCSIDVIPSAAVFSAVTHTHANARLLTVYFENDDLRIFHDLLHGSDPSAQRIADFVYRVGELDTRLALELATGLLHNLSPQDNWLWTRWMWDPTTGSGILPLLAGSTHNLVSTDIADAYTKVGVVSALCQKFGEGTGLFSTELLSIKDRALFANTAFLACAYSVYMYGAASWRLSREFNRLLPTLPGLARKLLGLQKPAKISIQDELSAARSYEEEKY